MSEYKGKYKPFDFFNREIKVGHRVLYTLRHRSVELHVMVVTAILPVDPNDPHKRKTEILEGTRESDGRRVKITRTHRTVIIPKGW